MLAHLILEDGTVLTGESFGGEVQRDGEVVFNTGMVGYPETFTDPSYKGQILVLTYPLEGNYGIPDNKQDKFGLSSFFESDEIQIQGLVVQNYSAKHSHFNAKKSLGEYLKAAKIPAITGIDTRFLTKKLREQGVMLGKIVFGEIKSIKDHLKIADPNKRHLVKEVSTDKIIRYGKGKKKICLVDTGVKLNIIKNLLQFDTEVIRVPYNYNFAKSEFKYDGLFLSNGPGDPEMCIETIGNLKTVMKNTDLPIFGICLGNQLLALASNAKTYKLKYGHRGQNQPCLDLLSQKCIITSQNHGFAVDPKTLEKDWKPWFVNLNDNTNEGIYHTKKPWMSAQFHPEANPGPEDANYLFEKFINMI